MVQAGRLACIFTPFALSIASLVCIIIVLLGGNSTNNATLDDLYFFKADLTTFANSTENDLLSIIDIKKRDTNVSAALASALETAKTNLKIDDYYTIYLWNYCAWNGDNTYSYCSPKQAEFWFNPVEVWGLNSTGGTIETLFPTSLKDALNTYETVSKTMFILYIVALVFTCLELLVGISAMFSRWGSFFTTFFSAISSLMILGAALTATLLFSFLKGAFNDVFKSIGITGYLGSKIYVVSWLAVAFSWGAGFFWLLSVCCCSGRSPYKTRRNDSKRVKVERTPYTYERVGSPYLGPQQYQGQNVPLNDLGLPKHTGYEPFRPQQV